MWTITLREALKLLCNPARAAIITSLIVAVLLDVGMPRTMSAEPIDPSRRSTSCGSTSIVVHLGDLGRARQPHIAHDNA